MDVQGDGDEADSRLPRRGEYTPPPWFERAQRDAPPEPEDETPRLHLSWPRTIGLLALVLLIVGIPIDFAIAYFGANDAEGRANMALGFVWAVVIEALAVWALIRLMTRS